MRKFIIASAAVLAFAGVASAQEAPEVAAGNNPNITGAVSVQSIDRGTTASVPQASKAVSASKAADGGYTASNILTNPNYSR